MLIGMIQPHFLPRSVDSETWIGTGGPQFSYTTRLLTYRMRHRTSLSAWASKGHLSAVSQTWSLLAAIASVRRAVRSSQFVSYLVQSLSNTILEWSEPVD